MWPDNDGWSATVDNMQVPMEMPPLEDAPIQFPLASRTDVEITQDQEVSSEIWTQEDTQTSTTSVEPFSAQFSYAACRKNNNKEKYGRIWQVTRWVY